MHGYAYEFSVGDIQYRFESRSARKNILYKNGLRVKRELRHEQLEVLLHAAAIAEADENAWVERGDLLLVGKERIEPGNLDRRISDLRSDFGDSDHAIFATRKGEVRITVPVRIFQLDSSTVPTRTTISKIGIYRRKFHHFSLTVDYDKKPVWIYTALDFSSATDADGLAARAPLIVSSDQNPEDHMYSWMAEIISLNHLQILVQSEKSSSDYGIEVFPHLNPNLMQMAGTRLNDAWATNTWASSIAILTTEWPKGLPIQDVGPVPYTHSALLEEWWQAHNPGIVCLPKITKATAAQGILVDGVWDSQTFTSFLREAPNGSKLRLLVTYFTDKNGLLETIRKLLKRKVSIEIMMLNPDNRSLVFSRFGIREDEENQYPACVEELKSQIDLLRKQKNLGDIEVRTSDLMPFGFMGHGDHGAVIGLYRANGPIFGWPLLRVEAGTGFWNRLIEEDWVPRWDHADPNNKAASLAQAGDYVRLFWHPYLKDSPSHKRLILYGEPLFARDKEHHVFEREVTVNERGQLRSDQIPCYSFLNSGEMKCVLTLLNWFSAQGITVEAKGRRITSSISLLPTEERRLHGIVLGSPVVNGTLKSLQDHPSFRYRVGVDGVHEVSDGQDLLKFRNEDRGQFTEVYALVSRRRGMLDDATVVTMISSAIGRATQGLGESLTAKQNVIREMLTKVETGGSFPDEFQFVFKVELQDDETVPSTIALVDWWPRREG